MNPARGKIVTGARALGRWVLGTVCLVLLGCRPSPIRPGPDRSETFQGDYPIRIVATVGMVADLARAVGGPHVQVESIMGPGVDPHLYKSTRDDVERILSADMVLFVGLFLEGRMAETLARVSETKKALAVGEALPPEQLISSGSGQGHPDPHVWMDVGLWITGLERVTDWLADYDPQHAADYRAHAAAYASRLKALDDYGKSAIATIEANRRVLVTSHDAFQYFGRAYGLEVVGVQGISTDSEAGLQQVNSLVELIARRHVQSVFVESSVSRKNIEAVVEGVQARGAKVDIGGELFSDAMGSQGTYEGTYEGMLDHNITVVTRALGGTAPERGLNGKLASPHP